MMHTHVITLHGRGPAYAGPIARRISTTSLQNPNFFRPALRSGLKQRQEAPRVAPIVRNDPIQQQQQQEYQQAFQQSEDARLTKEQQLDDIQRRLQERLKQRQRRTDRWIPPQYAEDAVAQRAAEQQARAAAREARRQEEEERLRREASDAAVASQFLQGRVRQKASRFADLVETIQESKQNRDPYRSRKEDDVTPVKEMPNGEQDRQRARRRRQEEPETQSYSPNYDRNNWENDYNDAQTSSSYLPPDVVRVDRGAAGSQVVAEVVVENGEEEEPVMVWTAGAEGLVQEPVRVTIEEAEYTDVLDLEDLRLEEEERSFQMQQQQQQEQQQRGRWQGGQQGAVVTAVVKESSSLYSSLDDEYIDW